MRKKRRARVRPVTKGEIAVRRFSTIVLLLLVLLSVQEQFVRWEMKTYPPAEAVKHMQPAFPSTRWQQQVLEKVRQSLSRAVVPLGTAA